MKKTAPVEKLFTGTFQVPPEVDGWYKDDTLIPRVSNGDTAAFELLYKSYFEVLYKFACRKLPSETEAHYIIEDLFKDIWHNRASLDSSKSAGIILFETLKKKVIGHYAKTFFK